MPEKYRIRYSKQSADGIEQIFEYIAQNSPEHARRMVQRILASIEGLDILPHRNRVIDESGPPGHQVRSMVVRPYLVHYEIDDVEKIVFIVEVRHGARKDRSGL